MVARKASKAWKPRSKGRVTKRGKTKKTKSVAPAAGHGAGQQTEPANTALQVETFIPKQVDIDEFFDMPNKESARAASVEAEGPKSSMEPLEPA